MAAIRARRWVTGSALLAALSLLAGCALGGFTPPHLGLRSWIDASQTQQARATVEAKFTSTEADLRSAGIQVAARVVRDYCSEWTSTSGEPPVNTDWGVQCTVEVDLYGGFSNYQSFVRALDSGVHQAGWPEYGTTVVASQACGYYSRGKQTGVQNLGAIYAGVSQVIPLPAISPPNRGWLSAEVAGTGGRALGSNLQHMLGCAGCGPASLTPPNTYGNLLAYAQHECQSSGALTAKLRPWRSFYRLSFLDEGYFFQDAQGTGPLQPPG